MSATNILAKMSVIIDGQTADFNKALKDSTGNLNSFTNNISKIATLAAGAFSAKAAGDFVLQVSKLAGESEGVSAAFERLPKSTKLMQDLKAATGNTVSELELMKRSVQASNFDISLQALPKLLQFATLRAQQTGQSVDYLVDSIVTGIGRKSPLILDNLGISATKLKEKLGGVSLEAAGVGKVAEAVGAIAEESLSNMAGFSDNASTQIQQLGAEWDNLKVSIGEAANSTGILGNATKALIDLMKGISGKNEFFFRFGGLEAFGIFTGEAEKGTKKLVSITESAIQSFEDFAERYKASYKTMGEALAAYNANQVKSITNLQRSRSDNDELIDLNKHDNHPTDYLEAENKKITAEINARFKQIDAVNAYVRALQEKADAEKNNFETITTLEAKLKEYQDQVSSTDTNDRASIATINQKSQALKEQIEYLKALVPLSPGATSPLGPEPTISKVTGADFLRDTGTTVQNFRANAEYITKYIDQVNQAFLKKQDGVTSWGKSFLDTTANIESWGESARITMEMVESKTIHLNNAITQGLSTFADSLGQAAAGVGNFGDNILRAIAGFMRSFGEQLIALGVGAIAADVLIENPYTAIAAGIALVALAGAASAAVSNTQKGISGNRGASASQSSINRGFGTSGFEVQVSGEFKIQGKDLVYIFNRQSQLDHRLT